MIDLADAERLAPPYVALARFRQIARRFLELYDLATSDMRNSGEFPYDFPHTYRQAAYFRGTVAELDRIAAGEAPLP